jgi:glycosyltransferase involved in cell wall biosynthesis
MALVTVLMPTFDHGETIRDAIRSLQQQSLDDFELLVVGDGAPSRTDLIVSELQAQAALDFVPMPRTRNLSTCRSRL